MSEHELTAADRIEIDQLFARYAWGLDTGDVDAVVATFADDGVVEDPFGRYTGTSADGIPLFFQRLFATPDFAGRQHWIDRVLLEREGDLCRARSYAMVTVLFPTGAPGLHLVAFYRDELVRRDGRWVIRERVVGPREAVIPDAENAGIVPRDEERE